MKLTELVNNKLNESVQCGIKDSFTSTYNNKLSLFNNTHMKKITDGLYIVTGSFFRSSTSTIEDFLFGVGGDSSSFKLAESCGLKIFDCYGSQLCCLDYNEVCYELSDTCKNIIIDSKCIQDADYIIFASEDYWEL